MELVKSISDAFAHGGIWMWAILGTQIATIAIVIERWFVLYKKTSPIAKQMAGRFEQDIRRGDIESVLKTAKGLESTHPLAKAVEAGAQAALELAGQNEIQAKMDEVLLEENALLDRRTGFLAMLGNVATLLGLLGTITGMIKSFAAVAFVNPMEKATLLAQGISEAMHCTAYGLIVAIPALALYAFYQNRASVLSEDLNQGALKVFNWLTYSYEIIPIKVPRPTHSGFKGHKVTETAPTV